MNRETLPELRRRAEVARENGADVEVDPVTLRSLIEATAGLLMLDSDDVVDDELAVAIEVARARFVEPFVEPSVDTTLPLRRLERDAGLSDRDRLAGELGELREQVRGIVPAWRRAWRRGRSS